MTVFDAPPMSDQATYALPVEGQWDKAETILSLNIELERG
jgi:hypothetical protein